MVLLAGKTNGEIETEAVNMHFLNPVAQRIQYHLRYSRMPTFSVLWHPVKSR